MDITTRPDDLVDEWMNNLPSSGCDEYADLDAALAQHATIWDPRRSTADPRVKPLALLDTVARLRHWQSASAAPAAARNAMGVLATEIRARAGHLYDTDLIDEVDRLRQELRASQNTHA